jgi:hypothetical protein
MVANDLCDSYYHIQISKKDSKKWTDLTEAAMQEKKTRDGCLRLLDVYRHQPEKGSPQATAELEYQVRGQAPSIVGAEI